MAKRVYSKMGNIPRGSASDKLVDGCLVLEGGAFRGLYTQGILDELMLNDINMNCVIGVSAGALGGMNYVSGQIGRSARVNLGYRHDSRYVGKTALKRSKSILDIGFLTEDRGILEPLDKERFMDPRRRFVAVATNCLTGETTYFEKKDYKTIMKGIRASATMPYISPMVDINGTLYLDGGCSCKIPYKWALDNDYEKIIVIKTRDLGFRKKDKLSDAAIRMYGKYPKFALRLSESGIQYNRECNEVDKLHKEGRLLRIAPSEKVTVGRIEGDMDKLGDLYELGRRDCIKQLGTIKEYLNIK
ncbi:MAG: patatin family protein [Lachnospiraceae bacterium]|nr:patatin family protein [Lachnospiraceae bacterium]